MFINNQGIITKIAVMPIYGKKKKKKKKYCMDISFRFVLVLDALDQKL